MFLSRIFINKVLPITKPVPNYDDYPIKFFKAKSKLYRISLPPKRNNMFIRIIAAIDSWYCNSLLLLSWLTRITKNNCKNRCSESETESATDIVEKWARNSWLLGWTERLGTEFWNTVSCLDWKHNKKLNQIACPVVWKLLHAFLNCLPHNFDWFVQSIKVLY